jgi:hyperosmotically inducible protein
MKRKLCSVALASLIVGGLVSGSALSAEPSAGQKVDDATMLAKIKSSLLRSPEVEGLDVDVDVKDGVVTLSGSADTTTERASAEKIAKTSDGVKRVENRIVVKPDPTANRPALPPTAVPPPTLPGTPPVTTPPPAN